MRHLSEGLVAGGHEVAIASGPEGDGEAWRGIDPKIEIIKIPGLRRRLSLIGEVRALAALSLLYRSWEPTIVHLHT